MSTKLQPPPYSTPLAAKSGSVSPAWMNWFREIFSRVGQAVEDSNAELSSTQSTQATSISTLNSTTANHTAQISGLQNNFVLSNGRVL